jgi:hypothetical protein
MMRPADMNSALVSHASVPRPRQFQFHETTSAQGDGGLGYAPIFKAIAGTPTSVLATASNSGTQTTAMARWCSVADRKLALLRGGLGERLLECPFATGLAGDR